MIYRNDRIIIIVTILLNQFCVQYASLCTNYEARRSMNQRRIPHMLLYVVCSYATAESFHSEPPLYRGPHKDPPAR